jgi:chaperonin GroEL (HSP60 family)
MADWKKNIIIGGNNAEHTVAMDVRRYMSLIEKAIQKRSVCLLTYKGKSRTVHPYQLLNKSTSGIYRQLRTTS